ncbi:hypothetical protein V1284_001756 [Nitrobacteraceae bacterium AZCC 2299]
MRRQKLLDFFQDVGASNPVWFAPSEHARRSTNVETFGSVCLLFGHIMLSGIPSGQSTSAVHLGTDDEGILAPGEMATALAIASGCQAARSADVSSRATASACSFSWSPMRTPSARTKLMSVTPMTAKKPLR